MEEVRVPMVIESASYDARNMEMIISFRMTGRDAMRASEAFRRAYSTELVFNVCDEVRADGGGGRMTIKELYEEAKKRRSKEAWQRKFKSNDM